MISREIKNFIANLKPKELFIASEIHEKFFSDIKIETFHQLLNRFSVTGLINRYSKGVYYKPGTSPITDQEVIKFLTDNKSRGFVSGDFLLFEYGIISDKPPIDTLTIYKDFKWPLVNVGNFHIRSFYSKQTFKNRDFLILMEAIYFIIKTKAEINYQKAFLFFRSRLNTFSLSDFDFLFDRRFYIRSYFSNAVFLFESLGLPTGLRAICKSYKIHDNILKIVAAGEVYD